jgi:hypothetical protein
VSTIAQIAWNGLLQVLYTVAWLIGTICLVCSAIGLALLMIASRKPPRQPAGQDDGDVGDDTLAMLHGWDADLERLVREEERRG